MIIPHISFRDCTRSTHPPFYRRQVCRDFDTPYLIPIDLHVSHVSVNDTTCTTQSNCSDHVCHLHSTASCDESLPPELQVHVQNIARRTDAPQRIYLVSFSMHGHICVLYSYLYCISHNRCLFFLHAPHSTARLLMQDSPDKHTVSLVCLALLHLFPYKKPDKDFSLSGSSSYTFDTIIITYILMPCWDKVCQHYSSMKKLLRADA